MLTLINLGFFLISRRIDIDFKLGKWARSIYYFYRWRDARIALFYTSTCVAVPVLAKVQINKMILRLSARISKAE